ncbi:MAG: DNA alkylation repair protein [Rikenellaceae bacterium]
MENTIIRNLRAELIAASDEKTKTSSLTFFKEEIKVYGIKSIDLQKTSNAYLKLIKGTSKKEVFYFCEQLWRSMYLEEGIIACRWSLSMKKEFTKEDFTTFENWITQYVTNWATCDTFCNHTVGEIVVMYPEFISDLKRWTSSSNRWLRRAAAVSLIVPAKKGAFLSDIFEIADLLLLDKDDMVQKGYGWLLKAATEQHTNEVFDYVMSKRDVMPRTSLRYAIEKMPKELKSEAMKKKR